MDVQNSKTADVHVLVLLLVFNYKEAFAVEKLMEICLFALLP